MQRGMVVGTTSLLVGSTVAIYAYALPYRFTPQYFAPYTLRYAGPIPLYQPWAVYRLGWAFWQRDGVLPRPLRRAGILGGLAGLLCGVTVARRHATGAQGATWATRRQIRALGLTGRQGVVLGKAYGRILRQGQRAHTLVVGPSQSGKSSTLLCTLLDDVWGSVIVHDPKEELATQTRPWREQWSRVINLAPTSETSDGYNPLASIRYGTVYAYTDADALATVLCDEGDPYQHRSDAGQHFQELARQVLVGGILAGHAQGATTLPEVARFVREELNTHGPRLQASAAPAARAIGQQLGTLKDNPLASLHSTVGRVLALYDDALVARLVSRTDFTLADVREGPVPMTLYLSLPIGPQQARLRPWTRLVLTQLLTWCMRPAMPPGAHPLLMAIDELPSLRYCEPLKEAPNHVAGSAIQLLYLTPSLNALTDVYGLYNPIREGCRYTLVYGPYDPQVARTLAEGTGEAITERERVSTSSGGGDWTTRRTVSTDERRASLLSGTQLMQLARHEALLLVGNSAPIKLRKVWHGQRPWKQRGAMAKTGSVWR